MLNIEMYFSYLIVLCISRLVLTFKNDSFTEELLIKPLFSDQLYTYFHFVTTWDTDLNTEDFRHTHLFPRALGEIIKKYNVEELHISLTGGLWRYEKWGYPVVDAAPGAEVWAWFKPGTRDVDNQWNLLTNTLSGLLCSSLNFVGESNSIKPEFSFRPQGAVDWKNVNNTLLRYANLPREIVCTENLTPFKKLLPCNTIGLASLLNSAYIYNARYNSIGLSFREICRTEACNSLSLELKLSISLVHDYTILGTKNWSLRRIFGQGLNGQCPLASRSSIYVDLSSMSYHKFELTPEPTELITSKRGGYTIQYAIYNLSPNLFNLGVQYSNHFEMPVNNRPILYANQYLSGYGQEKGGIVTKIYNNHWSALDVVLLQNIAWYVPVYLHTLKITSNGKSIEPKMIKFNPGKQRTKPYHIEIVLQLPPQSTTSLSIDFDYVFLKWQEYPPDANHGFYISSSIVSAYLPLAKNYTSLSHNSSTIFDSFNASRNGYLVQVRTENMIITLPTPDFSMPYNVICLACTVVALAFGPLHNITTKRFVIRKKDDLNQFQRAIRYIIAKINSFIQNYKKNKSENKDKKE